MSMQAGEKLSFIKPFTGERYVGIEALEDLSQAFLYIHQELIVKDPSVVRSIERFEESGFVTAYEASYKVESLDGSYLHVLAFWHGNEGGVIDVGMSVVEHTNRGVYVGGYMYMLDHEGVTRDTCRPESDDDDDSEDTNHFSLIGLYADADYIELALNQTDDEFEKEDAARLKAKLEESVTIGQMEKDMGYDQQPPTLDELVKLQALLHAAEPFTLPDTHDDEDIYR